ncbi:helix-turn-helix domain-containing protein [Rhodococcus hoagii]|nr:helix-turn-helix domain-containing protein [Prescottella equi]
MTRRALHGFDPARLKELRGEKGLSRSDLGRLSGVPYNTIRRWETGNSAPAPDLLARVAEVLGVDVDALAVIQDAAVSLASWRTKKGSQTGGSGPHALDMSPSTYSRTRTGRTPVHQRDGDTATLASLFGSSRSKSDPRGCARTHRPRHGTRR